jgi:hypothetical protein
MDKIMQYLAGCTAVVTLIPAIYAVYKHLNDGNAVDPLYALVFIISITLLLCIATFFWAGHVRGERDEANEKLELWAD